MKEKQKDPDVVSYPLFDCKDMKHQGVCHTFPNRYQGLLGHQVTIPAALIQHDERERANCLDEKKQLRANSLVRRNQSSQQNKTAAVYVLPPLPPIGSCLISEDSKRFVLKESLYELTIHGKSELKVALTPEGGNGVACVRFTV